MRLGNVPHKYRTHKKRANPTRFFFTQNITAGTAAVRSVCICRSTESIKQTNKLQAHTMRLITHNMLHSAHKKGVRVGYPLNLVVSKHESIEQPMNADFLKERIPRLNWSALRSAAQAVGIALPETLDLSSVLENEDMLETVHHALMEVHVIEGYLECPESQRRFPIHGGIPNMLLNEDEIPGATVVPWDSTTSSTSTSTNTEGNENENKIENENDNESEKASNNDNKEKYKDNDDSDRNMKDAHQTS